jgi:hypothetical protein
MTTSTLVQVTLIDRGKPIPVLLVADEQGNVEFHRELIASVRKFRYAGWSAKHLQHYVRSIRQLFEYYIAIGCPTLDEDGLEQLVWNYLAARVYGTAEADEEGVRDLRWRPCKWSTVKQDCRSIADFSDYCSRTFGYLPLVHSEAVAHVLESTSHQVLYGLKVAVERSVLGHLRLLRRKPPSKAFPARKQCVTSGMGRAVMNAQQAWDVIAAEKNLVFRMIWLLGFWGGPRISEQLNLWRCDVLPGELRSVLFDKDPFHETPLVILANPWEATFCGVLGEKSVTRRSILLDRFKLQPRPDLDGSEHRALWAGWKGMLETNTERHISQIFWADPEAAREYWHLHELVLEQHYALATLGRHPYLLINLDERFPECIGEPIKMSNVSKAWERAVSRVGLVPYRFGASMHGMRHFYKGYIEELGLGKKAIQVMMRHRNDSSQDVYGPFNARAVRDALAVSNRSTRARAGGDV